MMVAGLLLVAVHAAAAPDVMPTAPRGGAVS